MLKFRLIHVSPNDEKKVYRLATTVKYNQILALTKEELMGVLRINNKANFSREIKGLLDANVLRLIKGKFYLNPHWIWSGVGRFRKYWCMFYDNYGDVPCDINGEITSGVCQVTPKRGSLL